MKILAIFSALSLSLAIFTFATPTQAAPTSQTTADSSNLYTKFIGHWKGTLEYRDYSNDKRVTLPTQLDVELNAAGDGMIFHYVYDDGPGKTVEERETITIDPTITRYVVVSGDGKERDEYEAAGLDQLKTGDSAHLTLEGKGTENDRAVEVRTTIDVSAKSFSILRETRLPGQAFLFRHQYKFERTAK